MTRAQLMASMTAREYDRWKQLYTIQPFGEMGAYFRSAHIVQTLININRNAKEHPEGFPLSDFVLFADVPEPVEPSQEDLNDKIDLVFAQIMGAS